MAVVDVGAGGELRLSRSDTWWWLCLSDGSGGSESGFCLDTSYMSSPLVKVWVKRSTLVSGRARSSRWFYVSFDYTSVY
ncbi:hypothetical protein Hanom_Chr00s003925g01716731 [Helianthus anomalus]